MPVIKSFAVAEGRIVSADGNIASAAVFIAVADGKRLLAGKSDIVGRNRSTFLHIHFLAESIGIFLFLANEAAVFSRFGIPGGTFPGRLLC